MELVSFLLHKAKQFAKFARFESEVSQIDVVKNRDPLLKQLSDLKDFDEREELAKEHFKHLGTGSSRSVFEMNESLVLKIAINSKGLAQNLTEAQPEMQCECTNHIVAFDPKGKWSISHTTKNITEKDFKRLTGMSFSSYGTALYYKMNNEGDERKPKDYEEIERNPFFQCMSELVLKTDLMTGDLTKISSYAELNGKVVARDLGFDRDTYRQFYASDSSSSDSSSSS